MPAKSGARTRVAPSSSAKLARVLTHVAQNSSPNKLTGTVFDAPYVPDITLDAYLERMKQYMGCSEEVFIVASVLLTRLETALGCTIVVPRTIHRLALAAVVVAIKVQDDMHCHNKYYAEVGGLPLKELNAVEAAFVKYMDWRTVVTAEEYTHCLDSLATIYAKITSIPHSPTPHPSDCPLSAQRREGHRPTSQLRTNTCDSVADSNGSYTTTAWEDAASSSPAEYELESEQVLDSPLQQYHHRAPAPQGQAHSSKAPTKHASSDLPHKAERAKDQESEAAIARRTNMAERHRAMTQRRGQRMESELWSSVDMLIHTDTTLM